MTNNSLGQAKPVGNAPQGALPPVPSMADGNKEYQQISTTADPTAINRALYTDIPYAREIAEALGADLRAAEYLAQIEERKKQSRADIHFAAAVTMLDGRYRSTDEALAIVRPVGILELAAGFSPRGLNCAPTVKLYLETDQATVVGRKQAIVDWIFPGRDRARYQLRALDVFVQADMEAAGETFLGAGVNHLAIVHEGLFFYLKREEQLRVRDGIADFLARYSPRGAWISPDFRYEADGDEMTRQMRRTYEKLAGRPWTRFSSDEEVTDFMRAGGLSVRILPNEHLAGSLASERIVELHNSRHTKNWLRECRAAIVTLGDD